MIENPFDHNTVEKVLFATYKRGQRQNRRTRTFLRKMARHIEHAWEIGYRDGTSCKPLVSWEDLQKSDGTPMERDMFRWAYAAYQSGYRSGTREGSS